MTTRPVALALAALLGLATSLPTSAQNAPRPRPDGDDQGAAALMRPRRAPPGGAFNHIFRHAEPPKLGVHVAEKPDGILVVDVVEDGLAAAAGVQENDLLLSLAGERLVSAEDIRRVLAAARPGSEVELSVVREGQGLVKLTVAIPEEQPLPDKALADGHKGGFLGVELGEAGDGGVHVDGVIEESAAWYAGLEKDDVLASIDGKPVSGPEDVVGAISSKAPGSMVALAWTRDDATHETSVRLGRRPQPFGMLQQIDPGSGALAPQIVPFGPGQLRLQPQDLQDLHRDLQGFRFLDNGNGAFRLGPAMPLDDDVFGPDVGLRIEGLIDQLSRQLGTDLDAGDAQSFSIKIENGKVTIQRDGETETYDLDEDGAEEINLELPILQTLRLHGADGSDAITTIRIRKDGCDAPCGGNTTETGGEAEAH